MLEHRLEAAGGVQRLGGSLGTDRFEGREKGPKSWPRYFPHSNTRDPCGWKMDTNQGTCGGIPQDKK